MTDSFNRGKRRLSSPDDPTQLDLSISPDDDNYQAEGGHHVNRHTIDSTSTPITKSLKQSSINSPITYRCNLPPTCNPPHHKPARFQNPMELESHHRSHHAYTCSSNACNRIFPSQLFLDLHLNECHDPILLVRRENYQSKIFRCFESSCEKSFRTPKTRRLHLIDFHGYPSTFFFALPNQGLNDLYRKFGPGVSLARPDWKPRSPSSHTLARSSPELNDSTSDASSSRLQYENDTDKIHVDCNNQQIDSAVDCIQELSLVPRQIQFGKKACSKVFQR